ncbi:MAG: ABC transporter ATP-binding protein [Candidatus Geothermarchaeales archaeon]
MAEINIKRLTKKYGKTVAARDLDYQIEEGEFFVLLGPSGCGKTTVLLAIAGLIKVDSGEIWLGQKLMTSPERNIHVEPQERNVSMVFQDYALYPHMTVFKNIAFPLIARGVEKHEVERKVKETAKFLDISQLLDRKPGQLSGGQKQRVALGRAIVREPDVFLMDEPLANLDAKLRVYMRAELKKLQQKLGVTTVYVTHDQLEAMTMGNRIAILRDGTLQQVGTPNEVYNRPKNTFVAGFIGSPPMNLLEGTIVERNGDVVIDFGTFTYELSDGEEVMRRVETPRVVLGIRPEHIMITKNSKKNAFRAKVEVVELVGKELEVHLTTDEKSLVVIASPTLDPKVGEEVWLLPDENKIQIFDGKTERRIAPRIEQTSMSEGEQ